VSNQPEFVEVISTDESIDRYRPIVKDNLIYPVWAYNITLPVVESNKLNPLESVIYELIENKEKDPENIAALTGLNKELVSFIISRLQQTGLVNERLQRTNVTKESLLDKVDDKYIAATVYYDIKNEAFLPYIVKDGLPVSYANKNNNKYTFTIGISGESKEISATLVDFSLKKAPELYTNEVLNIIRRYKKSLKKARFINAEKSLSGKIPNTSIEVDKSPQLIYLHRQAVIPEKKAEIFVTNGFNGDINPSASRGFERHNNWLYKKLKERAIKRNLHTKPNQIGNLREKLNETYQVLINTEINSSHARNVAVANQADFFKAAYNEVEHLLVKSVLSNPAEDVSKHICSNDAAINGRNVLKNIKELGFNTNKLAIYFFYIKKGTLSHLDYNDPSMGAVIALNVISAVQNKIHPLIVLARKQPDFFETIIRIKRLRDAASHGDIDDEIKDIKEIKDYYLWLEDVYSTFGEKISDSSTINGEYKPKNTALNVSVQMDRYFNWHQKNIIPESIIGVIQNTLRKQLESDLSGAVADCASALQKSFYHASKSFDSVTDTSTLLAEKNRDVVKRKIGSCDINNIPRSCAERIKRACLGVDSTLGPNAMAFIYRADVNDLQACPNLQNFLPITSQLIELRGHNRRLTENDISIEELNKLLPLVFKIINELMEFFGE